MTNTSKTLVFFGNERLSSGYSPNGAPTLEALISAGYTIGAVVSNFTQATSRKTRELEIEAIAKKYDIPMLLPDRLLDIKQELQSIGAAAGVLVAYGKIVPQEIIDIFPRGIINIHPSLLPLHRGSTPIEQTILDGDEYAGVSLMKLVKKMDAGPIYAQKKLRLSGHETKQDLTTKLLLMGGSLLIEKLPGILGDSLTPYGQDESKATYTRLLTKSDGVLDTSKTAMELERQVRAFATWPKIRTKLFGQSVIVIKASVADEPPIGLPFLKCANNTFLIINELVGPSGKTMSGDAFTRGYAKPLK